MKHLNREYLQPISVESLMLLMDMNKLEMSKRMEMLQELVLADEHPAIIDETAYLDAAVPCGLNDAELVEMDMLRHVLHVEAALFFNRRGRNAQLSAYGKEQLQRYIEAIVYSRSAALPFFISCLIGEQYELAFIRQLRASGYKAYAHLKTWHVMLEPTKRQLDIYVIDKAGNRLNVEIKAIKDGSIVSGKNSGKLVGSHGKWDNKEAPIAHVISIHQGTKEMHVANALSRAGWLRGFGTANDSYCIQDALWQPLDSFLDGLARH